MNNLAIEIPTIEYFSMCRELEYKHSLFLKFWELGKPYFTKSIPTACIQFDLSSGVALQFLFNQTFWNSLDDYNRLFIICHECLHVILNHGMRFKNSTDKDLANIAMDVVVNQMLVDRFEFDRNRIKNWKKYCWVDTVFANDPLIQKNESYEYYYNRILQNKINISSYLLVDSHDKLDTIPNPESVLDHSPLTSDEKKLLQAGLDINDLCVTIQKNAPPPISNEWLNIIVRATSKVLHTKETDVESWLRKNRRLSTMQMSLKLPSIIDSEEKENRKCNLWLFLDTSGSCSHFAKSFFRAYQTIPQTHYATKLFGFSSQAYPIDTQKRLLKGFGGTSFYSIEAFIQKQIKTTGIEYPDAVFVITDGYGDDSVNPQYPNRWNWFIHNRYGNTSEIKSLVPSECNIYKVLDINTWRSKKVTDEKQKITTHRILPA